jgi:antitoxin ParD1/3/4
VSLSRINARLSRSLAEFAASLVGEAGRYETPSEYIRDPIRRDMGQRVGRVVRDAIPSAYRDLAEGAVSPSTGDFQQDMQMLAEKDAGGWRSAWRSFI